MSKPDILDLDKINPPERIIKLKGKNIDVSKIPSKVTLEIMDRYDELNQENPEAFDIIIDLIMKVIKASNKDVTKEWLIDNTTFNQLYQIIEFIMKPILEQAEMQEEGGKKKFINQNRK